MQMWHKLTARAECSCLLFRKKMFFCFNIFYPKQQKFQMLCFITQLFLQFAYLAQDPSMRHVSCRVESVGWYVMVRWPELNPHPPMKHFSHIFIMTDMNKVRTCKIYKERQRKSWGIHLTDYLSERWQHVLWRLCQYLMVSFCWLSDWIWGHELPFIVMALPSSLSSQWGTLNPWIHFSQHSNCRPLLFRFSTWLVEIQQVHI